MNNKTEALSLLKKSELFLHCEAVEGLDHVLSLLVEHLESITFKAGQTVFCFGEAGEELYFVLKGEVAIQRNNVTLCCVPAGGYFGDIGFFLGLPRTCTVKAALPSMLLVLTRKDFHQVIPVEAPLHAQVKERVYFHYVKDPTLEIPELGSETRDPQLVEKTPKRSHSRKVEPITRAPKRKQAKSTRSQSLFYSERPQRSVDAKTERFARIHMQRILFNHINTQHDGHLSFSEMLKFRNKYPSAFISGFQRNPEEAFLQIDDYDCGYVNEASFCAGMDGGLILKQEQVPQVLKKIGLFNLHTKRNTFASVVLHYLFLAVTLFRAPAQMKEYLDEISDLSIALEMRRDEYRFLNNAITARLIDAYLKKLKKTSKDFRRTSIRHADIGKRENAYFQDQMASVHDEAARLEEELTQVRMSAPPGVSNILEFFAFSLPFALHERVDFYLRSGTRHRAETLGLYFAILLFVLTINIIPLANVLMYHLDRERQNELQGEVYATFWLFLWIVLLQARQDALMPRDFDQKLIKAEKERHDLSLVELHCTEALAENARDLYLWIEYLALHQDEGLGETETRGAPLRRTYGAYVVSMIHGTLPLIMRYLSGKPLIPATCWWRYGFALGNTWPSIVLFFMLLSYLQLGKEIYLKRLKLLQTFTFIAKEEAAKSHGLPYLNLSFTENVIAWAAVRGAIMQDDQWKHYWVDAMISTTITFSGVMLLYSVLHMITGQSQDLFTSLLLFDVIVISIFVLRRVHILVAIDGVYTEHIDLLNEKVWEIQSRINDHFLSGRREDLTQVPARENASGIECKFATTPSWEVRRIYDHQTAHDTRPHRVKTSVRPKRKRVVVTTPQVKSKTLSQDRIEEMESCLGLLKDQAQIVESTGTDEGSRIMGLTVNSAFMLRLSLSVISIVFSLIINFLHSINNKTK